MFEICIFFRSTSLSYYDHLLEMGYSLVHALSIYAPTSINQRLFIYLRLFMQKYLKSFHFPCFCFCKSSKFPNRALDSLHIGSGYVNKLLVAEPKLSIQVGFSFQIKRIGL